MATSPLLCHDLQPLLTHLPPHKLDKLHIVWTTFAMLRLDHLDFFDLPRELLHLILQFVNLNDLAKFDSSITNSQLRPLYLSLVNGMTIDIYVAPSLDEMSDEVQQEYGSLEWLLMRKIVPSQIHMCSFHPLMLILILNAKAHLKSLFLHVDFPDMYFREIGSCPSLLKLSIIELSSLSIQEVHRSILSTQSPIGRCGNPRYSSFSTDHHLNGQELSKDHTARLILEPCLFCG
jgi:hypothetical protein